MTDVLADAWQRKEWADDDGRAFSDLCLWFPQSGAYGVLPRKLDGDRWQASFHRAIKPAVEAEKRVELARRLGTFLDGYRAALNYTAYQLALLALRKDPSLEGDRNPESVEFPIFRDPDEFRKKNRVKKLPDEYRDALEAVQPYDGRNPFLWVLHELARELRHRIIHPTAIFPAPDYHRVLVDGVPIPPTDVEIVPRERLDDGDVVLYFTLAGVSANADVHPQFVITVGIDHPLCRGQIGTTVVSEIGVAATRAMNAIETRFFGPSHDLRPVKTET